MLKDQIAKVDTDKEKKLKEIQQYSKSRKVTFKSVATPNIDDVDNNVNEVATLS